MLTTAQHRGICSTTPISTRNVLFLMFGALLALPPTQPSTLDEFYVQPTPALHAAKGDITTVLLVNNENSGRNGHLGHFVNVRPEVGFLKSTARTFIQEGVTTEYATQIVGTTLENGRLYAQVLKKSSRVFYDNGQLPHQTFVSPTVVTSWVGDNLELQTKSLLENHNDLFNADQPDWQDIDDRLLIDGGSAFVGNTDFIDVSEIKKKQQMLVTTLVSAVPGYISANFSNSNNNGHNVEANGLAVIPLHIASRLGQLEENARELAVNKVLPIGDLPTYTVRNHFSPSGFSTANTIKQVQLSQHSVESEDRKSSRLFKSINNNELYFNRSPKHYYQQLKSVNGNISSSLKPPHTAALFTRQFSTTTYYGFADFTTIVGDSVIVFSPSTYSQNINLGHVTSIKGEATLDGGGIKNAQVSTVAISINTEFIAPTLAANTQFLETVQVNNLSKQQDDSLSIYFMSTIMPSQGPKEISHEVAYSGDDQLEISHVGVVISNATSSINVENEVNKSMSLGEIILTVDKQTLVTTATYSRPSDQEVLEIYASLSRAEAASKSATQTKIAPTAVKDEEMSTDQLVLERNIITTGLSVQSSEDRSSEATNADVSLLSASSSVKILGGATTIFFEDDPFANFVEPTSTLNLKYAQVHKDVIVVTDTTDMLEANRIQLDYETTTNSQTTMEEYEDINDAITRDLPKIIANNNFEEEKSVEEHNSFKTVETDGSDGQPVWPPTNVSLMEIVVNDDIVEFKDCIRTSQTFLTQKATTTTHLNTVYEAIPGSQEENKTAKIETLILPTFDILETTKHYCIKPKATKIITATNNLTESIAIMEVEDTSQLEKPQLQLVNETEVEVLNETNSTTTAAQNEVEYEEEATDASDAGSDTDADTDIDLDDVVYSVEEDSGEEIELIYKTLYTTYTYLTTFFDDGSSTSISSHTEVFTNVLTSSLKPGSGEIKSTDSIISPTANTMSVEEGFNMRNQHDHSASKSASTSKFVLPTELESILREGEYTKDSSTDADAIDEKLSFTTAVLDNNKVVKTYFTTYTYYTTIFVEGETETMSRTVVYTNYVTDSIAPTTVFEINKATQAQVTDMPVDRSTEVTNTILANNVSSLNGVKEIEENMSNDHQLLSYSTMIRTHAVSTYSNQSEPDLNNYTSVTLVTDVRSSSSNGDHHIINQKLDSVDDQISSESNTDEIRPSPTLLLQTSFTTFTYYTTMYNNDDTNVVSRLETITNVVTETLQPSKTESIDEATLPITYFTTFTYWTKLAKYGEITTLSREETISNIIPPSLIPSISALITISSSLNSYVPLDISTTIGEAIADATDNQIDNFSSGLSEDSINVPINADEIHKTEIFEPTTYYTTYTYYTTSYDVDTTITDSRFETVTNVVMPTLILPDATKAVEDDEGTSKVSNIDGLIDLRPSMSNESNIGSTLALPKAALVLYDRKKIIDSEGISTLYFTTEVLPTTAADGSPSEITSSMSSLYIDEAKKALQPSTNAVAGNADGSTARHYKTGLVRLIEGTRIANHTTTLYQSKVIGTFIENRYAQIIESTSSFIFETNRLNGNNVMASGEVIEPTLTPITPPAIEATQVVTLNEPTAHASIADNGSAESATDLPIGNDSSKDDDEDETDEDEANKGRLPFQSKKHTFTPVIRPFASRNRPQFAPKKKSGAPSSATIITRIDFTPTITATPALKTTGRFSTLRKGGLYSSPISTGSPVISNASSSRRSFGRPIKSSQPSGSSGGLNSPSISFSSGFVGSRNRLSSSPRPLLQSSTRRAGVLIRPSSSGIFRPVFSTSYAGNSRIRVKPTGLGLPGYQNTATESITTLTPDVSGEEESTTPELQINDNENEEGTLDAIRRNQNPLLRFRRPINRPAGFTPASQRTITGAVSARRNPLTGRAKSATTPSTTTTTTPQSRPRSFQRPQIGNIPSKPRPQNSLFPPRGLLQKQNNQETNEAKENKKDEKLEGNLDADDDSEYEDEDEEDNEDDVDGDNSRRRRSNSKQHKSSIKAVALETVKTDRYKKYYEKPERSLRVRRETDKSLHRRSNFRNRFRRPKLTSADEERNFTENVEPETLPPTTAPTRPRMSGRFVSRYTGLHSTQAAAITIVSTANHRAIRPTRPTNGRAQFTLREKDNITTQKGLTRAGTNNFRRPQTAASARRTSPASTSSTRRLKSYKNNLSQDSSVRNTSPRGRNNLSRTRTTMRGRSRNDYNADLVLVPNVGTITVTHVLPAEVTIPIVNGKITEYKNVITAKTSTEVLGPQQFTSFVGSNGQTMLALIREDSSVNFGGATEITQYVLHESTTTTVIFTPTTIRGRKTSFSHIIPSTVYSVENVVSTSHPQISANAPLANILLSQLLLGNIGLPPANPLLGALGAATTPTPNQLAIGSLGTHVIATPVTEYRTHTSTYVTTVFEGMSTVLPVTFQGKKILTTVYDTTAQTITATEFVTDTIVTTSTQQPLIAQVPQVNNLLLQQLLLQQQLQPQIEQLPILHSTAPQLLLSDNIQDLDSNNIRLSNENENDIPIIEENQSNKVVRKKSRKSGKSHKRKHHSAQDEAPEGSSIITLYVSGRRPGEFSTILSTVPLSFDSTVHKRQALSGVKQTTSIDSITDFYVTDGSEFVEEYMLPELPGNEVNDITVPQIKSGEYNSFDQTQSLESIVGDVETWLANITHAYSEQTTAKLLAITSTLRSERFQQAESRLFNKPSNTTNTPVGNRKNYNFLV
ncbi:uncharacterized protein LOC129250866 [Anastrepha obliqua]|uniref:uncharacterized protein LOC129250866 n=1 Tax=Anastrepha obliqua TaxID=95512 RepID=UPI00240A0F93|nr:uncharacterized protein LOC129250866 [Anastrepha obliqua]XP_054746447.1 uncharacterized protein LOC129250866 [Anastrepha obliqua]XP_054746448.1 uncharacterized protein LOC129250866 [Anastrepha obliqua]XP_054746449.1 uncharacterized protein LOC129250866 [Anastrepha obliqua]XP_054746451.1 uncharacterized protein LOC129250866 [Anastrepha obliqua]